MHTVIPTLTHKKTVFGMSVCIGRTEYSEEAVCNENCGQLFVVLCLISYNIFEENFPFDV